MAFSGAICLQWHFIHWRVESPVEWKRKRTQDCSQIPDSLMLPQKMRPFSADPGASTPLAGQPVRIGALPRHVSKKVWGKQVVWEGHQLG